MSNKPVLFTVILIVLTVVVSLVTSAYVGLLTPTEPVEWQMWLLRTIMYAVITSIFVGILAPMVYKHYGDYREKKKIFKALYGEVESNLSLAQKVLPLAECFSGRDKTKTHMDITYFDLQHLHTYSYEDFRRSGYLLSLNGKARELLEEVYELIFSHNHQTDTIRSQEVDYSSYVAMVATIAPRTGGYSERLKILIEKLKLLREELKPYA